MSRRIDRAHGSLHSYSYSISAGRLTIMYAYGQGTRRVESCSTEFRNVEGKHSIGNRMDVHTGITGFGLGFRTRKSKSYPCVDQPSRLPPMFNY